jgi:hypothetical protein
VNRLSGPAASLPGMQPSQTLAASNPNSSGQTSPASVENPPASQETSSPRRFSAVFSKVLGQEEQASSVPARKPGQNQSSSPNVFQSSEVATAGDRPLFLMEMLALAEGGANASNPDSETDDMQINSSSLLLDADGHTPAAPQSGKSKSGTTNGNSQDGLAESGGSPVTALPIGAASQAGTFGVLAPLLLTSATPRELFPDLERELGSEVLAGKSSAGPNSTGVASGGNALTLGSSGTIPSSTSFSANRGELAFSARLVSLNPAEQPESGAAASAGAAASLTGASDSRLAISSRSTANQRSQTDSGAQRSNAAETSDAEGAPESATSARPSSSQENDHGSTARALQPDALADSTQPSGGAASQDVITPFGQAIEVQSTGAGQHGSGSPAAGAETRPGAATEPTQLESSRPEPTARDIKLQVSEGNQRAEVRLVDRGGVVQMSVRTPDTKLAGTLRDDLPTLSAKLENAGFRAEVWRPAAVAAPVSRLSSESLTGQNLQQDDSGRRRQDTPDQDETPQPRQPKVKPADSVGTQAEKDFAWYISNLR